MGNWWDGRNFRKKEPKQPKVPFKLVRVQRAIPSSDPWLIYSQDGEVYMRMQPDDRLREAVGARPGGYFLGRVGADSVWEWKGRYKGRPLYW